MAKVQLILIKNFAFLLLYQMNKVYSIWSRDVNLFSMELTIGEKWYLKKDSAGKGKTDRKIRYATREVV